MQSQCDRCGAVNVQLTMSRFNTEMICCGNDSCQVKEKAHPRYAEAERMELEAVRRGDLNFPGIGLPPELHS